MASGGPKVIVVGAGIIGASIAWHLTRRGATVAVVDARGAGGVATPNSFSWINSNYSFDRTYFELRHRAMAEWRRLAGELPELPVSLSGSIYLPAAGLDLESFVARHSAWGYRIALIDAARLREVEPRLIVDGGLAAHAADEGAAEAGDAARLLLASAAEGGATVKSGVNVEGLAFSDARVTGVRTAQGALTADAVVIAAGVATPDLLAGTGFALPLTAPPGLLAHTMPVAPVTGRVLLTDGLHIRQKQDGSLLLGADFQRSELSDDPGSGGRELLRRLSQRLRLDAPAALARTTTGYRPTPGDGLPAVGRIPGADGLYIAVMHSGVTLAPAIGLFAASELVDGARDPLIAPYAPERFRTEERAAAAGATA